jgi:NAD(P)H-nitrite reductase large subunit
VYRNIADLEAIMEYADKEKVQKASVVGGGVSYLSSDAGCH